MNEIKTKIDPALLTKRSYQRAVGPRLRVMLVVVFVLVALIAANSGYLASITFLEWSSAQWGEGFTYQNYFYLCMFSVHLVLGSLLVLPFLVFGIGHMMASYQRRNRRAVRIGYALFGVAVAVLLSGILLVRVEGFFDLRQPLARSTVYWLHVACPLVTVWLYWLHRLAGPRIKWRYGMGYCGLVGGAIALMVILQAQDPRDWGKVGSEEGFKYFQPSKARTTDGKFIPSHVLMNDQYCLRCHKDVHAGWSDSVHRFSSFNNAAYLASIQEAREFVKERDGSVKASRWCAGCHDPVPFFSGEFDDPSYDIINNPTAHAGITCTVCHGITSINGTDGTPIGNADYTIEEPLHYPFASSDSAFLQGINNLLVKAKPAFHKKTFLKPFHKSAEFCSVCHKVHLPREVTHYRDFLRGQNHYDAYLLSGVSGHGASSFYYPDVAQTNCNGCHMPLKPSGDFGARIYAGSSEPQVHDHLFPSANTGISWLRNKPDIVEAHRKFLTDIVRVDIFGIKDEGRIDGKLTAPLRPEVPTLEPGGTYLFETVIRTLKLGHLFTQGTVDSNEVWLEVTVRSGDRILGRSGARDELGKVDPWSHFVNVFLLDREGRRINRRNAADIFVPLYNHQIPPGAGQTVHYSLTLPPDITEPVTVELRLNYRKFDQEYMAIVAEKARPKGKAIRGHQPGEAYVNKLPIVEMAFDTVTFPLIDNSREVQNGKSNIPEWQRWNDYGIGLFLKGKAELRQADQAFVEVGRLGRYDGPLNRARVLYREGRLDEAVASINEALVHDAPAPPPWTVGWLSGLINREQGQLAEAERNFRGVLEDSTEETRRRKLDFSKDYRVVNLLGETLFDLANREIGPERKSRRLELLRQAVEQFEKTLQLDSENVTAHHNLHLLYATLQDEAKASYHQKLHARYKPDDNARDRAVAEARRRYPAANFAAEALVIYPLDRPEAFGLTKTDQRDDGDTGDDAKGEGNGNEK